MKRTFAIVLLFLLLVSVSIGSTITHHLYINRGTFLTVKNTTFPFLAFNATSTYDQLNEVIKANTGDTLLLVVINNDTALHGFAIKNSVLPSILINPGDSGICSISSSAVKAFVYYDSYLYPDNRYLGLGGVIYFFSSASAAKTYYWNIKEHQTSFSNSLASGGTVNWNNYEPDYFTINSKSFPDLQSDTMAKINAQVGDTVYIVVANTGQSAHSLHFHGFHATCVYADAKVMLAGWEKDTWGLFSMDVLILRLVPDKPGQYSVHDHNLVAITGGNTHPNGMFTIMNITP